VNEHILFALICNALMHDAFFFWINIILGGTRSLQRQKFAKIQIISAVESVKFELDESSVRGLKVRLNR
jgi:hypothetical protein